MEFTSVRNCKINDKTLTMYEREDGLYDVCSIEESWESEEYHAEGVDELRARVVYANQVMFLAGAN